MDVHDGLGTDGTHTMWEPPGYDESASGDGAHGYDGYDDSTGHDAAGSGGTGDTATDTTDSSGTDDGSVSGTDTGSGGTEGSTTMTVEVEGQTRELPAEHDYTGDGRPDAAVETADGKVIVFADTEDNTTGEAGPDGKADEAYIVDKATGKVVGAAHIDPSSGTWVEGTDSDGPSAVGSESGSGSTGTGETGETGETGGTTGETTGTSGGQQSAGVVTVEYGGHQVGVEKTIDTDDDGVADSGVLYTDGKAVVLTDTGGDAGAEQVAVVDPETGQITDVAHVDPQTGEWEEGPATGATTGTETTGTGTGTSGTTGTETTGTGTTGTGTTGTTGTSGEMTVNVNGETQQLPAEKDYTGDGQADAAVETQDGKVIVFADTENNETGAAGPDGKADEAWIVDKATGKVVGAAHVDPQTGEWVDGADTDGASSVPAGSGSEASS